MGGPSTQTSENIQNAQSGLSQANVSTELGELQASQALQGYALGLEQPAINYYTGLTTNANTALQAAAPQIGQISSGMNAARQNILNTIAPGASRDYALSQLQVQQGAQNASLINTQTQSAYDKLANLGAGIGAFSLGQGNLGLGAGGLATQNLQGASATQQGIMNIEQQGKQGLENIFATSLTSGGNFLAKYLTQGSPGGISPGGVDQTQSSKGSGTTSSTNTNVTGGSDGTIYP